MKGGISLFDFIEDVKRELLQAEKQSEEPYFELREVNLEVSFVLDTTAKAGAKFVVVEFGGEAKAQQAHKVTLKLFPTPPKQDILKESSPPPVRYGRGGGGRILK